MPKQFPHKYSIFFLLFLFFFSVSAFCVSLARDYYEQAKILYSQSKYFEASGLLTKALAENPYYTDAQILLGDSYTGMGNHSAAWEIYLQAEKRDPDNPNLLVKLAKTKMALARSRTDTLAAEYYLQKAYKLAPRDTSVFTAYGEFYMKIHDYQKALDYYSSLGDVLDSAQIFLNRAKIYEQWGKNDKALEELKKAETIDGENPKILLEMGKIFIHKKDYHQALTYVNAAYAYDPKNSDILETLSILYIREKNFEKASQEISHLILNNPGNTALYFDLAFCYESLGSFEQAISVLQEGLKQDYGNEFLRIRAEDLAKAKLPLSSAARENLAQFYINSVKGDENGDRSQKLFFLKRALALTPLNVNTRMQIANIYRQQSYLYEYLRLLKGGLFLDPKNTELKDQLQLNQKFVFDSLSYRENLESSPTIPLEPILQIDEAVIQADDLEPFSNDAKHLLLEAILNTHSLNAFVKGEESPGTTKAQFTIQFRLIPSPNAISLKADIIYIPTGAFYRSYNITEYGNDRLVHVFLRLASNLERDIPKIGRILKIQGEQAVINMGAQQGMKLGDSIEILFGAELPNKIFSTKEIDPEYKIAKGKVIELGENISKISFRPLDRVVFNIVQKNQSIVLKTTQSTKRAS